MSNNSRNKNRFHAEEEKLKNEISKEDYGKSSFRKGTINGGMNVAYSPP